MIGKTVSQYIILEKLGSGGMGVVYKARDPKLDRFVALKFLPPEFANDFQALERFQREARAVAALDHPSICTIHDIGSDNGQPFIVMQLLEGQTLKQRISEKPLKVEEIIEFGIQIADGLAKAHSKGIIHRDIKPANIFITSDGHAKLLDFGLAKAVPGHNREGTWGSAGETRITNPGAITGTVAYMSPEQAHGEELDARTDLFSFGAVLYEMTTGHPAFAGRTNLTILDGILRRTPTPAVRLNPETPPQLEHIINKALEKNRENRSQSAAEIRADLRRLKRDSDSQQLTAPSGLQAIREPRLRKWAVPAGIVVVLVVITAVVALLMRNQSPGSGQFSTNLRLTQLFASNQGIFHPSLSADGKVIAFVETDKDRQDLFVSRTAGGGRVRVTNDEAKEWSPQISPDGERILFTRLVPGKELPEICIAPTFGGGTTVLVSGGSDPAWSPDGKQFVFVSQQPGATPVLAVADISGQNVRTILETDATYIFFRDPAWSPDGSQIAVIRSMGGVSGEIWLVPAAGGTPVRPWKDPPEVTSDQPVFSADGRGIIHSSNRNGATNIWMLHLDGAAPERLTSGAGPDESPSVARDGTIAFANTRYRSALLVHDPVLKQTRELLSHASILWAPVFSPDGKDIAVSRAEPDGSWRIWIVPMNGEEARRLTPGPAPEVYSRFTPDGKWVIYSTWRSTEPDRIWRIPHTGGVPEPITPMRGDDDAYGDVSPDGKWLAFARTEENTTRIYIAPVGGGEARRLTQSPSSLPRWSPDGKWIAFSPDRDYNKGIFVIAVDGSGERRVTQQGGWPVWEPGGKRIAYLSVGPDWNQQVRSVPMEGGPSTVISGVQYFGTNFPIDFSSKGLLATTNAVHLSTEIWLASQTQ